MKQIISLSFLCLFAISFLFAQTDFPIGKWKAHLPYRAGKSVTQSAEKIYYATDLSIVSLDKEEFSIEYLSKTDGLSNVGIRTIQYNRLSDILMVVYDNSVIDLVKEEGIFTLNNIKNFLNIVGDKSVNNIFIEDGANVYLAAAYGVSKLNIEEGIFVFTTFTGVNVKSVAVHEGFIYAATAEGIYRAAQDNLNLDDFGNWTLLGEAEGFPQDYTSSQINVYNNALYFDLNGSGLYRLENGLPTLVHDTEDFTVQYLSAEGEHLLVGLSCGDCDGKTLYFEEDGSFTTSANKCVNRPIYAVEDEKGQTWFADQWRGFRYSVLGESECRLNLSFNSPYSQNVKEIAVGNGQVWIASGGVTATLNYLFRHDGLFSLIDGNWAERNRFTDGPLSELFDFFTVAIHPENGTVYGGSFLDGLAEITADGITVYDDSTSSLNNALGDLSRTRVSGLAFDADNNLWVSNHAAARPFSVLTNEGKWQSFDISSCTNAKELLAVTVDDFGYKWFVVDGASAGVVVYDTGEDLEDTSDDRCRTFSTGNSALTTNSVNSIAVDLDGDVWVGTADGAFVFQCGPNVFDECNATEIVTDQDEFNLGHLLSGNDVQTIAIDGANRKWFGTTSGIFVQSADGKVQEARFTAEDSPLFDNQIIDIAIDQETGEVFIGTAKGVISYRGEATQGGAVNSFNVLAFPNPVRPEYDGPIAIRGLAENANVKITDVSGQLIYETRALGGQAIWDGRDYNGRRASSGVYLVFSTSKNINAPDAIVTKILVMN